MPRANQKKAKCKRATQASREKAEARRQQSCEAATGSETPGECLRACLPLTFLVAAELRTNMEVDDAPPAAPKTQVSLQLT